MSVDRLEGARLPYLDNMVNLLVVEDASGISREEMLRVLVPFGKARLAKGGEWEEIVKPWPDDRDEWTHWLHGPGNNAVSRDRRVGISRNLQWIASPLWGRHHNLLPSVSAMVTARGRLFTIIDEGPISMKGVPDRWALVARDAFNGLFLWKRPIRNWGWKTWSEVEFAGHMRFKGPSQLFRRLVAVGDVVYVTLGFDAPVVALEAATGAEIRRYEGTANASEILVDKNRLFLARNAPGEGPGKEILAVDAAAGSILWEKKGFKGVAAYTDELARYTDAYLTAGETRLFFLDAYDVVALDRASGQEVWRCPRPEMEKNVTGHYKYNHAHLCSLVYKDGRLFLGQMFPFPDNLNKRQEKLMVVRAMEAASGRTIWEYKGASFAHFTPPDLFVNKGLVWTFKPKEVALVGLDVKTGEEKKKYPAKEILVGHHARCYRNKATERFYMAGEEGIEYVDFATGKIDTHHWARGACRYGILPGNGFIYLPPHSCGCHANAKLNGFIALTSDSVPAEEAERLEKGPAFGKAGGVEPAPGDWPVYRHDNRRSGYTPAEIPAKLSERWTQKVGGRPTAPVIAGGRVFVASRDGLELLCLDAATGEVRWRFTTDGPVDTPPSSYKGTVILGSHGGTVTALRAEDGTLIWRFRAAPDCIRLASFSALESPWPVHGSVLIEGNKVYAVAGRSMNLNGGLYVCALDADTGACLQKARLQADTKPKGELQGVVLPDLLVSDGNRIAMRKASFAPDNLGTLEPLKSTKTLRANDGGLLDGTWFNSTFWVYGGIPAQMLVFDEKEVCGVRAYKKFVTKSYPQDIFTAGKENYRLFASAIGAKAPAGKKKKKSAGPGITKWTVDLPIRAEALVITREHLYLAGAAEGKSLLVVHAREDGRKAGEVKLPSAPSYDGMAAAEGRLYLALKNGAIVCLSGR